jgi:hypothetical protein
MKKVHYVAGVIGAAAAAPGLVYGPAAIAAPGQASPGKTVSLQHRAAATAASGCTGVTEVGPIQNKHYDSSTHFWWKNDPDGGVQSVCIGTVAGYVQVPLFGESYYRMRIWAHSGRQASGAQYLAAQFNAYGACSAQTCIGGGQHRFSHGFHLVVSAKPVEVCGVGMIWSEKKDTDVEVGPPQCATVG